LTIIRTFLDIIR